MDYKRVITHPGQAHRDEFLGCALIVAKHNLTIERRDPTEEDLEDERVLVIDEGGRYEPAKGNLDHHQDASLPCALHLVADLIYPDVDFKKALPWWDTVDYQDKHGVREAYHALGIVAEIEVLEKVNSPISEAMLRLFSKMDRIDPFQEIEYEPHDGDPFHLVMTDIGDSLLETAVNFQAGWDNMRISGGVAISATPMNPARFRYARENGCVVIVEPNNRGAGFKMTGVDGKGPDFRKIETLENVDFVHNTGFMCVIDDEPVNFRRYLL